MDATGLDSDGREFKNANEVWTEQASDPNKKTQWYHHDVSHWEVLSALPLFLKHNPSSEPKLNGIEFMPFLVVLLTKLLLLEAYEWFIE